MFNRIFYTSNDVYSLKLRKRFIKPIEVRPDIVQYIAWGTILELSFPSFEESWIKTGGVTVEENYMSYGRIGVE